MSSLDDVQRRFAERLDAEVQRRRGQATPATPADFGQRLAEYEAQVRSQAGAARQRRPVDPEWAELAHPSAAPVRRGLSLPFNLGTRAQVDVGGTAALRRLDGVAAREFALDRYYPKLSMVGFPTVYCETLPEFYEHLIGAMDISRQDRRARVARLAAQAEQGAAQSGGGIYGVSLPGNGCYVNGWLFAYRAAPSARAALSDARVLPEILTTVVHEKLGHGFLGEYSALGQEETRLGLGRYDIARRFDVRLTDSPEGELLARKEHEVYAASQLLEEGWATWIEDYFRAHLAGAPRGAAGGRYTVEQVWRALADLVKSPDAATRQAAEASQAAIAGLFLEAPPDADHLHAAVLVLQRTSPALDDAITPLLGQPLRYVVGYLLFRELEGRLGTLCLPYAACIAANVTYGLAGVSLADLTRLIGEAPRLNPDSRLAQLRLLDLANKDDPLELARRAHDGLSLTVPEELRGGVS